MRDLAPGPESLECSIPPTWGPRSLNVYAIVEDSGTQIKMAEGDLIDIDIRELDDKGNVHHL